MLTGNIFACPECRRTITTNLSYFARGWRLASLACPYCGTMLYIESQRKPLYEVTTAPTHPPTKYHDIGEFMKYETEIFPTQGPKPTVSTPEGVEIPNED